MQKYLIPFLGAVMAAVGTFSELGSTPVGAALSFTGILGLMTLWSSRGEAGRSIRKRAFYVSAGLSSVFAIYHVWAFKTVQNEFEPWVQNVLAGGYMVALIAILAATYYVWFAFKRRSRDPRSKISSALSFFSSLLVFAVLVALGISNVLFSTIVVANVTMANLSPPMVRMLTSLSQDPEALSQRVTRDGDILTVRTPEEPSTYSWSCEDLTEIRVMDAPFPTNATDKTVMRRLCQNP